MDFNFFKKKENNILNLTFNINNNQINTSFVYSNKNLDDATKIAAIIYALNNGMLFDAILDSLVNVGKNNQKTEFITLVLNQLNKYYSNDQKNEIIIKPLETFHKNAK